MITGQRQILRILIDESDWWRDSLLYEAIQSKAKELNLGTPSLLYGIIGFGWSRKIRRRRYWFDLFGFTQRSPIVVEIANADHCIARLLPFLEEAVSEGLITLEDFDTSSGCERVEAEEWPSRTSGATLAQVGRMATRLRVHFRPSGSDAGPLHLALIEKARDMELMGATIFPDLQDDEDRSELTDLPRLVFSPNSQLIAEFVDDPAAIERFTLVVREMAPATTMETASVRFLRRSKHLPRRVQR